MNRYMKSIIIFFASLCMCIAAHDLYCWTQKGAVFKKTLKDHADKVAANSELLLYTSLNKEVFLPELEVRGIVPTWLQGTLVRNSTAKFETSTQQVQHIFDGCAMLHAFSFKEGKVSYANKFLETDYYKNAMTTGSLGKGFSADPCRLIFANLFSYFKPKAMGNYDNANVNVSKIAEKFVALTETPMPIEFDLKSLNTIGHFNFDDKIKGQVTTAHPHNDFETEESFNYITHFGRDSFYHIYSIPFKSKTRKLIASVPVDKPSYMHSFGITKNYIILTEIPFRVNPLHLLFMNKPFIKNFAWNPQEGTIFTVVNRNNGTILGRFKGEPFFTFHHVNAFEEGNKLVVDLVAYKDASIINELTVENLFNKTSRPIIDRRLTRFIVDINNGLVTSKILSDACIEMPRINYQAYNMKPYQYVYGRDIAGDRLAKINVDTGVVFGWQEQGCSPAEPVFVVAPNAQAEDDGVILSVILDTRSKSSFLLVLDAHTMKEIGRALLPHHVPFQVHGDFFNN